MSLKYRAVLLLLLAALGCSPGGEQTGDRAAAPGRKRIAVIPKGTAQPFWKAVHAGAARAASEADMEIQWIGPENEDDRKQQIDVVQNFIAGHVDAIVLAPLDEVALVAPVELAAKRNIPVVIIDSDLKSTAQRSFVATDNLQGGRDAARELGRMMGGKGKAIMLRYNPGSASTDNRERGFLDEMKASFPDIRMVSDNQYAGVTKQAAMEASQILLNKFGGEIQGIFCPNESSTFGMMRALENSGLAGKISFVGFDTSGGLLDGLRAGTIQALISQDPFDMGYQGVKTAVAAIKGEAVPERISTNLAVVRLDNLDSPEISKLVNPDLSGM